jgi:hypothetical protein
MLDGEKLAELPFEPIPAAALMPSAPVTGSFTFTEGKQAGQTDPYSMEPTADGWVFSIEEQGRVYMHLEPDGSLAISREDDLLEQVRVEYEPAIIVLPAHVGRDELPSGQVQMTVWSLKTDQKQAEGLCDYQVTHIWASTLKSSTGALATYNIRQKRQIDLKIVQVELTLDSSFAAGMGYVAGADWRVERALGLWTRRIHNRAERSR